MKDILLTPLSLVYKSISLINLKLRSLRRHLFSDIFIISIDNISFGGTGKTSAVLELSKYLLKKNLKVSVVLRGYKSSFERGSRLVMPGHSADEIGDEAVIYREALPEADIFVGNHRITSIKNSIKRGNDVLLLDDGFQSSDIKKDLKIMLVNPLHKYYYLRNFKFTISGEDIILFYSGASKSVKNHYGFPLKEKTITGSYHFVSEGFFDKKGDKTEPGSVGIIGFSGTGDNNRFREDLAKFNLKGFFPFRDHHSFTEKDIKMIEDFRKKKNGDFLVCTFKDFVRIPHAYLRDIPLLYIKNRIEFVPDIKGVVLKRINEKKIKI